MLSRLPRHAVLAFAGTCIVLAAAVEAQQPRSLYDRYTEPIQIFKIGLGTFTKPMSSTNKEAQAFFDQGFQMMYSFAKPEAVRSFREAWKRDADCAICYWGEAWAWGSYLNAPMTAEEAPHAYAAAQKALSLKSRATPKERALIDAMAVRYVEKFDAAKRVEQDRAYADAMQKVSAQYPDDLEIATLYADALFLLEPRRGTRDVNDPNVHRLHQVLESILARDVHHPGACHLYVHATESTVVPGPRGGVRRVPRPIDSRRQPHQPHAVAHLERGRPLGRFGARQPRGVAFGSEGGDRRRASPSIPSTTCTCCSTRRRTTARARSRCAPGKDYTKLTGESFYEVLTLIRFGRFDEVLQVTNRPKPDIQGGLWDFAQGYAHLKQGNADFASALSRRASRRRPRRRRPRSASTRRRTCSAIVAGILEGEIQRTAGDLDGRDRVVPARGRYAGGARLRRAGAAAVLGVPLARRRARGSEAVRRGGEGVSHRAEGPPAQRLVAARPAAGARGHGQRRRPRSTPTSRRAGRARTPGSGRRASDGH